MNTQLFLELQDYEIKKGRKIPPFFPQWLLYLCSMFLLCMRYFAMIVDNLQVLIFSI